MKPCPFCGSEIEDDISEIYPNGIYWVEDSEDKVEAIENWDRRV
jgi:hypothetical protein